MDLFKPKARTNEMTLAGNRVTIAKLTPAKWRELFAAIENLPNIVLQVMSAPQEDRKAYMLVAIDESLEEVCGLLAILTDMDSDYIYNNAGLDEIIEYLTRTAKHNRLGDAAKNVGSLLGKQTK